MMGLTNDRTSTRCWGGVQQRNLLTCSCSTPSYITGSMDLTVREWLNTQSYAAQRDFGLLAIENIKKGIWR